ncbi:extracellular solute-binding protein [Paludisphaera mucosa]|uniref:Extracellular solute-binding protein n=1 Tax=Paludisphaera mucosa TaxID=3030827 RepID=A0ABT6FG36_9BACT|nr:extracellular solute-binding protein [Paludisphaera mucosa]MDG3006528.1 extracellular solute-binding protein [Paludisphaera mucosa]
MSPTPIRTRLVGLALLLIPAAGLPVLARAEDGSVVVYSALDREFSEPILKDLARREALTLRPKFDVESTKTVGLVNAIMAESVNTRCDLFWNNEILNTIRLKRKGLLQPFQPKSAGDLPATFRDPDGTWYGFAARARVLIVNTRFVPKPERPRGIADLAGFRWNGRVGIAKPLFGTTATHAACLFAAWGDDRAKAFFRSLKSNDVQVLSGNRQVAAAVGSGQLVFGLTDTDDAMLEIEAGNPVEIIYPDREPGGIGTLFIPNTLALIKDAPHPEAARKLADAILSAEVENRLADGPSAQIPLLKSATKPARVETPATVHAMEVDFQAAADAWDRAAAFLAKEFAD